MNSNTLKNMGRAITGFLMVDAGLLFYLGLGFATTTKLSTPVVEPSITAAYVDDSAKISPVGPRYIRKAPVKNQRASASVTRPSVATSNTVRASVTPRGDAEFKTVALNTEGLQ